MTATASDASLVSSPQPARTGRRRSTVLAAVSGLAALSVMAWFGGTAKSPSYLLPGIIALSLLVLTCGGIAWWLLVAPLRSGDGARPADAAGVPAGALPGGMATLLPQAVAAAAVVGGLALSAGGAWDGAWHRTYGVGIVVNDFFWPPHIVIYASMGITALFAAAAGVIALRGEGSPRHRLRRVPHIAGVGVVAAYAGASGPSDLLWHRVYGVDITAWSLPHLLIAFSASLTFLMGVVLVLSRGRVMPWTTMRGVGHREVLAVVMLAIATVPAMEIVTGDFPGRALAAGVAPSGPYLRPDAWFPVTMVVFGVLLATVWSRTLRRTGAATAVGLTVLVFQAGLMTWVDGWSWGFGQAYLGFVLLLPAAVAVDVWAWLGRRRGGAPNALVGALVAAVVSVAATVTVVGATMTYPRMSSAVLAATVLVGLPLGMWASWIGGLVGDWAAGVTAAEGRRPAVAVDGRLALATYAALGVVAALVVGFHAVAPPPETACSQAAALCLVDLPRS